MLVAGVDRRQLRDGVAALWLVVMFVQTGVDAIHNRSNGFEDFYPFSFTEQTFSVFFRSALLTGVLTIVSNVLSQCFVVLFYLRTGISDISNEYRQA